MKRKTIKLVMIMMLLFVICGCNQEKNSDSRNIIGGELFYSSIYYQEKTEIYLPLLIVDLIDDVELVSVVIEGNYQQNALKMTISNVVYEGQVNKYNLYYLYLKTSLSPDVTEISILEIILKINDEDYSYKPQKITFINSLDNGLDVFKIIDMPIQTPQQQEMQIYLQVNTPEIKYVSIKTTSPHLEIVTINDISPQDFYKEKHSGDQTIFLKMKLNDDFIATFNFNYNIVITVTYENENHKIVTPIFHLDKYVEWLKAEYK